MTRKSLIASKSNRPGNNRDVTEEPRHDEESRHAKAVDECAQEGKHIAPLRRQDKPARNMGVDQSRMIRQPEQKKKRARGIQKMVSFRYSHSMNPIKNSRNTAGTKKDIVLQKV